MNNPVVVPEKVASKMLVLNQELAEAQRAMDIAKGVLYDMLDIPNDWVMRYKNNVLIIIPPNEEVTNEDS